ncbi:polysaccharide deacetylase family protein [Sporosarcina sp. P33]|uniref:polysaccharide deacetylase family protein n=1 Tax=Sporosarcina sp. P33 TaxID=1930764 RepID=UPI0009BF20FF|nr:polysaccharide deacetylase family protein [Sporosarcina sp. P33]
MSKLNEYNVAGPRRDFIGYGRKGLQVKWPYDARVVLNIAINYEEGSEQMKSLGDNENETFVEFNPLMPNHMRDIAVESVFEYGSRVGIWRLQRLFDELNIPVTIFGCAVALERNLEVANWIKERGHDVCVHGWRWEKSWNLPREEEKERIRLAYDSIKQTCGVATVGWYSRYGPSVNTRELLVEHGGFLYDSDAYNDELPYYEKVRGKQHLVVPYNQTLNDGKFVRPQGFGSATDFLDTLKRAFDYLWNEGETHPKMMTIGLHPRIIGQPYRISALKEFLQYVLQKESVWIAKRLEIAEFWKQQYKTD